MHVWGGGGGSTLEARGELPDVNREEELRSGKREEKKKTPAAQEGGIGPAGTATVIYGRFTEMEPG